MVVISRGMVFNYKSRREELRTAAKLNNTERGGGMINIEKGTFIKKGKYIFNIISDTC